MIEKVRTKWGFFIQTIHYRIMILPELLPKFWIIFLVFADFLWLVIFCCQCVAYIISVLHSCNHSFSALFDQCPCPIFVLGSNQPYRYHCKARSLMLLPKEHLFVCSLCLIFPKLMAQIPGFYFFPHHQGKI